MFNFDKDHKALVSTQFFVFLILSIGVAVVPAVQMQQYEPLPSDEPLTPKQRAGLENYIAEGCVACHTQQVRSIEMDKTWGSRPSIPSDYYYSKQRQDLWRQSPSLLGSERTGPDLTSIGERQPSQRWHLLHLYNPRSVVKASVMPAYPWLFEHKSEPEEGDVVVNVPKEYLQDTSQKVVASDKALELVAYLRALKQEPVGAGQQVEFSRRPDKESQKGAEETTQAEPKIDGAALYAAQCASCHQPDGEGIKGAFPPLAGSEVVTAKDAELMTQIILEGYNARSEYGVMPAFADRLSDEEIAAIMNHERSSWGNDAPDVNTEQVAKIRASSQEPTP